MQECTETAYTLLRVTIKWQYKEYHLKKKNNNNIRQTTYILHITIIALLNLIN